MKKKFLMAFFALLLTSAAWAQDVIVTTDAQRIEAKIMEVSKAEIKYVAFDNQDGPVFVLSTEEINSIIFSNGQIKLYDHDAQPVTKKSVVVADSPQQSTQKSGRIYRDGGEYIYNDISISESEVEKILKKENQAAYKEWSKAKGMLIGGSICTGIGGGLFLGSLIPYFSGDHITTLVLDIAALPALGVGLGLALGSASHYKKAIDIYNSKFDHAAVQLKWQIQPNGVGLALAF